MLGKAGEDGGFVMGQGQIFSWMEGQLNEVVGSWEARAFCVNGVMERMK